MTFLWLMWPQTARGIRFQRRHKRPIGGGRAQAYYRMARGYQWKAKRLSCEIFQEWADKYFRLGRDLEAADKRSRDAAVHQIISVKERNPAW